MHSVNDVTKFLQAIFPDYGKYAVFANLNPPAHTRSLMELDPTRDCYWSIAAFPDDGLTERTKARATYVRALVVDDVGTKVSEDAVWLRLREPTAIVETSSGNYQWVYRLSRPVAVVTWSAFFAGVEQLIGQSLEGRDAVHLFRLPFGVNTKPERNGFGVRLITLNPEITLDPGSIPVVRQTASCATEPGHSTPRVHDIAELARILPNEPDVDRAQWVERAHQFKALALDEVAAAQAFDAWSRKHSSYDEAETARVWDSLPVSLRTAGLELLRDAEAADAAAFVEIMNTEAKAVFDDGEELPPASPKPKGITATPFKLRDASSLPLRDWLYGNILIRKFITMTVAPGGAGKSSLIAAETLAQVTGCNLLWEKVKKPLRVWLWNLEDPFEETERKIVAAALRHKVTDLSDRLFVDSGRDQKLVIATVDHNRAVIQRPVVEALVAEIKRRGVDVLVVDPFVSCHEVPENDNIAQDKVVKEWGRVAELGNCSVHLIDHTRKAPNGTEVWTESARGAKAKTDAARVVRVINRMSDDEGVRHGVSTPRQYFYTLLDKANMTLPPPMDHRDWFHLESVNLGNGETAGGIGAAQTTGDAIGVAVRWTPPSAETMRTTESFEKVAEAMGNRLWRTDSRAAEWVGKAIGPALEFNEKTKPGRTRTDALLKGWLKDGLMQTVIALDKNRIEREFIQIKGKHEAF